jgi:hypothetical protein
MGGGGFIGARFIVSAQDGDESSAPSYPFRRRLGGSQLRNQIAVVQPQPSHWANRVNAITTLFSWLFNDAFSIDTI